MNRGDEVEEEPQPPNWAVWVARAVAVVVVVPVRLAWEGIEAVGRAVWRWVLQPLGVGLRWVARVLGAGLRWFGEVLARYAFRPLWAVLRSVADVAGRGLAAVGTGLRWLFRVLARFVLRPAGRVFAPVGRWLRSAGVVVEDLLRRAARVLRVVVRVVVLKPLAWGWRALVVWPLRGLWWVVRLFARALVWAWRLLGRVGRAVVVPPARWVRRVVLAPVGRAIGHGWRAVVVAPARWVRGTVVEPVRVAGRRLRAALGGRRDQP
ncbi:hypothetical protein [Saccharothrix texasensis]|uniref:hypothetical protein n=1 Tax=Saccharothrix texasensis TaxID=103734 RepID=UPI000F4B4504|nr:hypothetical protein [Saccharothrix texasensis]